MRALSLLIVLFVGPRLASAVVGAADEDGVDWVRVAEERTRGGDYAAALDAYQRSLALGDTRPTTLVNSAELLMALGRVREAVDHYREAVEIEERAPNRREHVHGLALGYFGLAVALDRDLRPEAAREAVTRGLAFDPGLGTLATAARAGGDLFLIPPGDVFYYLGLVREVQGRNDDAIASFRDYLRMAKGPYVRIARDHIARLEDPSAAMEPQGRRSGGARTRPGASAPPAASGSSSTRLRVLHHVTLRADGPLVAPLIDAAWRINGRLLDACLSEVELAQTPDVAEGGNAPTADGTTFKVGLDLKIEATGRVSSATAKVPDALGASALGSCIENAVRTRFQVSRPNGRKPTRVHMELVLGGVPH